MPKISTMDMRFLSTALRAREFLLATDIDLGYITTINI